MGFLCFSSSNISLLWKLEYKLEKNIQRKIARFFFQPFIIQLLYTLFFFRRKKTMKIEGGKKT